MEDIGGHIMPNVILNVKNLAKYFDDKKVLKDISLQVNEGDVIAVVGAIIMAELTSSATKKKLQEINKQEEQMKREEHYRKMEELLEKMNKELSNK